MHDDSFKQKPTQKFCEKLINFEKPQKFLKGSKVRSEKYDMHDRMIEMRSYQMKKMIFRLKSYWVWGLKRERNELLYFWVDGVNCECVFDIVT